MATQTRLPHVHGIYFQHKVLTWVHGKSHFESLKTIHDKLKANASLVPSTLGSGSYGHLGLLLSPTRYATISNMPFISPPNPGPFVPPAARTGPQITAARDVWQGKHLTFKLSQATEKVLIAQVVDAMDATYLAALCNPNTSRYRDSICTLVQHLFSAYGWITPQQVKAWELNLLNMPYDLSLPVDNVFNVIDNLIELADHASITMSPEQAINIRN